MAGPEVHFGITQGRAFAADALQAIKQLRQAYLDVTLQPEDLRNFHTRLQDIEAKFNTLATYRMKTVAAQIAVHRLLETVHSVMQQMEAEHDQQPLPPPVPKRLWQALCVCLTGPSKLMRLLQQWQERIRGAVEAVEKEKDNLQPQLWLHQLESLPEPCVTNRSALEQLVDAVEKAAASRTASKAAATVTAIAAAAAAAATATGSTSAPSASASASTQAAAAAAAAAPPHVVQLLGMAGMGKSILALQAALELDKGDLFSGGVYFLRVDPQPSTVGHDDVAKAADAAAMEVQRALLRRLRFSERAKDAATVLDLKADLATVFAETPVSYLLVLDDVWNVRVLEALRCPAMQGAILITARSSVSSTGGNNGLHTVQLQPTDDSRQAAKDLMEELLATAKYRDQAIIDNILNRCDGHLLAVSIMGKALRKYKTAEGWQDVAEQFISRLETDAPNSRQVVFSALRAAVDGLQAATDRESLTAVKAFGMLQHLQSRRLLPMPMLQLLWSWVCPNEQVREVEVLLEHLVQTSLLHRQDNGFYAHSLVDEFLAFSAGQQPTDQPLAECALPSGYRSPHTTTVIGPSGYRLPRASIITPVQTTSWRQQFGRARSYFAALFQSSQPGMATVQLCPSPEAAPPGLLKLAVLLLGYGRPHAVKWAQHLLGVEPVDAKAVTYLGPLQEWAWEESPAQFALEPEGRLCTRLGGLLWKAGRYVQAEPWHRRELATCQHANGPEDPRTATSLNNLARLLGSQGKLAEAYTICKEALAIRRKALAPDHPDTASSLHSLAVLLHEQGKLAEAESMCREALAVRQKALGPEHPETASSLHNLACLLLDQGKLEEAESLCEEVLSYRTKTLGREHPDTTKCLNSLACLLQDQGRPAEAELMHREALAIRQKVLGPEHQDTACSLNNLAVLLERQGKLEEALAIRQKVLGPEHLDTASSLHNLACLLQDQGRPTEAEPMHREALAIRQKVLGPD